MQGPTCTQHPCVSYLLHLSRSSLAGQLPEQAGLPALVSVSLIVSALSNIPLSHLDSAGVSPAPPSLDAGGL